MRKGSHHTEESKKKLSDSIRGHPGVPCSEENKRKMSKARRGIPRSEETKRKMSLGRTGKKYGPLSEETKRKISEANRGKPGNVFTEEYRKKLSVKLIGNKHTLGHKDTLETRIKKSEAFRGEKSYRWKGGISQKYCDKFNSILKENVRETFGRKCFLCGVPENGRKLEVHHCDFNKGQGCGRQWNLVPLCKSCHTKTSHNRHYYFNLLSNYWAMWWIDAPGEGYTEHTIQVWT